MKGIKHIKVWNKRISYEFELKRRITVIDGDSGTGKTTLVDLVSDAINGRGAQLDCECACKVLTNSDWKLILENTHNSIVFIDEGFRELRSDLFSEITNKSSNYYVIIERDSIPNLTYSYKDIYKMSTSGKYHTLVPKYNIPTEATDIGIIITEDSNSGYEFFKEVAYIHGCYCDSAKGKDNIANKIQEIRKLSDDKTLVIGDGAAIGSTMKGLLKIKETYKNVYLHLEESFEFMLLNTGMFSKDKTVRNILDNPYKHISTDHISWERYFTDLLQDITSRTYARYSKSNLNRCYINKCCFRNKHCEFAWFGENKVKHILDKYFSNITFRTFKIRSISITDEVIDALEIYNKTKDTASNKNKH